MVLKLQTLFWPLVFNLLIIIKLVQIIKTIQKKSVQKIEMVKYSVLFNHTFYDENCFKVGKFCRYESSPSFFKLFFTHISDFYSSMTEL